MRWRGSIWLLVATLLALAFAPTAHAAVPVTITADEQDGSCDDDCSLRDAVAIASRTGDVVQVPAGTFPLSLGQVNVGNVAIQGAGAGATIIRAGSNARVLQITSNATIAGVTITGGNANREGGGIEVGNGQVPLTLTLVASEVADNFATASQGVGGGIMVTGLATLLMTNTTVSANRVLGGDGFGAGAGIYVEIGGRAELRNSTVSGNTVLPGSSPNLGGGIGLDDASTLVLENVTVASNSAMSGGGIAEHLDFFSPTPPTMTISDTIVAGNAGTECSGAMVHGGDYNLADDATCAFTATGDKQNVNPLLGPLQLNAGLGPTRTHALAPGSPAINAGDPATCKPTDQRGAGRPAGACDIGAFEYVVPTLTVITQVVNDHSGTRDAADFSVHVRAGADVAGSPQPGSPTGTSYTLAAGTYTVSADTVSRYAISVSGDCAPDGTVALAENQPKTCTVVANDPAPQVRKSVNVKVKRGTVRIKRRGAKRFVKLTEGRQIPLGSTIDTLRGRVTLTAAADNKGGTATADFYDGIFKVGQTKGSNPITNLKLIEKLRCPRAGKATISAKRKKKRRLWGDGRGRFRTEGSYSSATVRGTKWLVEDRCKTTLTRVVRGRVAVRDFAKKKTIIVRKGKRYIARARKR